MISDYRGAVIDYAEAALTLDSGKFTPAWETSERARKRCEELRDAVLAHEYEHGCLCP